MAVVRRGNLVNVVPEDLYSLTGEDFVRVRQG